MNINLTINPSEVSIILKEFIKTYVHTAGCEDVVLGLSGGIDSAVVAVLCAEALGKKHVHALFMPDDATPIQDKTDLSLIIKKFNLTCEEINISSIVSTVQSTYTKNLNTSCLANIKARTRMMLLYAYAHQKKSLICGTSNKSEILIGYFTKYGDGGVDLQPLGDLYKTQVYQVAKHLEIPQSLINKAPSAGLYKGQTDEQEIGMSYAVLDKILYGLELKMDDIVIQQEARVTQKDIDFVCQKRSTSQHKRRLPLMPKIGVRTPGLDWRSPIQKK